MASVRVLLVESDRADQLAFQRWIEAFALPWVCVVVGSSEEAKTAAQDQSFDLIIFDASSQDSLFGQLFLDFKAQQIPTLVTPKVGAEETAIYWMQQGATSFLIKDAQHNYLKLIPTCVEQVLTQKQQQQFEQSQYAEMLCEHKQVCEVLQTSEARFRATFEQAAVGMCHTSLSGKFLRFNQRFCEITGYSAEELQAFTFQNITHPDDFEIDWQQLQRLLEGEITTFSLEKRYIHKKGHNVWVALTVSLLKDEDGNCQELIGVVQEISDRKEAEAALRRSEAMNQALIRAMPDLLIRMNRHGCYLDIRNQHNLQLMIPTATLVGAHVSEAMPPDYAAQRLDYVERTLRTQRVQSYEQRVQIRGEVHYEEVRMAPCLEDEVLVIIRDITDRKQAELDLYRLNEELEARVSQRTVQLQDQKAQLRDFFDNATDLIQCIALDGRILYVNQSWQQTLGYTEAELQQMVIFDVIHPDAQAIYQEILECIIHGETCRETEVKFLSKEGREIIVEGNFNCRVEHGIPVSTHGIFRDVTQRRQTEKQLRDLSNRLRLALSSGQIGIWEWDVIHNQLSWDDRMYELYGVRRSDSSNAYEAWLQAIHPEDQAEAETVSLQARQGTGDYKTEFRVIHPDGSIHYLQAYALIERDQQGEAQRMIGVNYDITDLKQAEHSLRQQAERERLLRMMTERIYQSLDLESILTVSVTEIRQFLQCDRVLLFQVQLDTPGAGMIVQESVAPGWTSLLGQDIVDPCFTFSYLEQYCDGKITVLADIENSKISPCYADFLRQMQVRANLAVPILQEDRLWGLLIAHQCACPRQWSVTEVELLKQLSDQLGIAIRQASLFQQVQVELTERRQAEAALQTSEAKNRAILEAMPDLLMRLRRNGTCLDCFLPSGKQTGDFLPVDHHLSEVLPTELLAYQLQMIELAIETGELQVYEHQFLKNGSPNYEEIRIVAFSPDEVLVIVRDITASKQSQLELRRNQDLREAFFEESADALFVVDPVTDLIIDCNQPAVELFEAASKDELINICRNTLQRYPLSAEELALAVEEVKLRGFWSREIEYVTRTGNLFWGNLASKKISVAGVDTRLVRLTDITARKQMELLLQQQLEKEQLLVAILEHTRHSLDLTEILKTAVNEVRQLLQVDRILVYQVFSNFMGAVVAEAVAPTCTSVMDCFELEIIFSERCYQCCVQGHISVVNDSQENLNPECLFITPKDDQVKAKIIAPIVQEENERLWGLLIAHQCDTSREWEPWEVSLLQQLANHLAIAVQQSELYHQLEVELSERKQAELSLQNANQELQLMNAQLAQATRLKDEFLANMSHELRTPLNAILGMSETLQDGILGELSPQQLRAIEIIEKSGRHLLDLITDILDLSKIEAGKLQLQFDWVPVPLLCTASLAFIQQVAHQKKIQVSTQIPEDIPEIEVDERRIRQVLINLLSNAVKFTPEGGKITLSVVMKTGSVIQFRVIDTGIGIAAEDMAKLFQSFVQIDSSLNRQYNGTGLGLALVKRIVELHRGTIAVSSNLGQGSCFTVTLPCSISSSQSLQEPIEIEEFSTDYYLQASATANFENHSLIAQQPLILLVEEHQANIDTLSNYLQSAGYQLIIAKDSKTAVELTQTQQLNLIVIDVQLSEVDGLEAIQQIRAIPEQNNVPIIALTTSEIPDEQERCLQAGANYYVTKPIRLKNLAGLIRQILKA